MLVEGAVVVEILFTVDFLCQKRAGRLTVVVDGGLVVVDVGGGAAVVETLLGVSTLLLSRLLIVLSRLGSSGSGAGSDGDTLRCLSNNADLLLVRSLFLKEGFGVVVLVVVLLAI